MESWKEGIIEELDSAHFNIVEGLQMYHPHNKALIRKALSHVEKAVILVKQHDCKWRHTTDEDKVHLALCGGDDG